MIQIDFCNSKATPILLQVDPWACVYKIEPGETFGIAIDISCNQVSFCIDEDDTNNRILTVWECADFFVVIDDKRIYWQDYQTNL